MAKYKFKKESKEPSDEFIRSKMDFNKILKNQQVISNYKQATKPLYKNRFFMGFMILLGVICLVIIFEERDPQEATVKPNKDSIVVDTLKK
ncbi:MAG: hypothetical protein K0R51_2697 [Cytophagaceae bacterium]|jgi:hypothetical protein|nr:hypothetical protein [Cytophagaceae bacterium]